MACAVIELVDELAENGLHQQQKSSSEDNMQNFICFGSCGQDRIDASFTAIS